MPASADTRKVLLVNPNQMKPPVAPLALDYLADALRRRRYEVDVLDLCFSSDTELDIRGYFARSRVLAVAVTLRNTDDAYFASREFFVPQLSQVTGQLRRHTDAPVVLGGAGFSVAPEAILEYCSLDLGVWGEGELALPLLMDRLAGREDHARVPGLVWRDEQGLHQNRPRFLDLSTVQAPARSAIDNRRYFDEGGMGCLETKRGCPNKCIYCADPVGKGREVRLRSPGSVADEFEALLDIGIDHLHLCDSEFNVPESHAREVCGELAERRIGDRARWYTYASPGGFSQELAALCRRAGCAGINFGVDSGCDGMLRRLGRDFTVEDIRRTADSCRREGIICMFDLLLGGPGETVDTLRETVETIKVLSPDRVGTSLGIRVYPNTRLAALVRKQGSLVENPNLQGDTADNDDFFSPVYYLSAKLAGDAPGQLRDLVGGDERFFFVSPDETERNYNYNDNTVLVDAIRAGYRGAFWDILRRLRDRQAPSG